MARPIIGITTDVSEASGRLKADVSLLYAQRVADAGGVPVLLAPLPDLAAEHVRLCHGFVFTGGDDPHMEAFGVATDPRAKPVHPQRQAYELRLLDLLRDREPGRPVLGVCLGMQFMCLHAGGAMDQHLPDRLATHARHKNAAHEIVPCARGRAGDWLAPGQAWSNHRQGITNPGRLIVVARSGDDVIEGVMDPDRAWYVGVQWHPERTDDAKLGKGPFAHLVDVARGI